MKLTIFFLTAAFLNVTAKSLSQNVTFSGKDVSLIKVFEEVEKQTGYVFFYTKTLVKDAKLITIDVSNIPLTDFLPKIFTNQPIDYLIENNAVIISRKALKVNQLSADNVLAPPGDVQGRVMNENGDPLADASVTLKGTSYGTKTDNNGYFKIEGISAGEYILEISFVGYSTKTAAVKVSEKGANYLNFSLTPSLVNLDQLTVTGTLSKRAIRAYPATIAVIKQEDLKNRNLNNISSVLEAVPGIIMQPGYEKTNSGNLREPFGLLIRGTAGNGIGIKYLIDGIEIVAGGGTIYSILQTIDPNNIEKIEVLKGPMASTLYGNGAAGGIISITTKKGKAGKTKFNFKTMFTQYANDYADYNGYNQNYSMNISGGDDQFNYLLGTAYNLYPTTKLTDINNGIDDKTWSYNVRIGGKMKNIAADISLQYGSERSGVGSTAISDNKYRVSLGLAPYPVNPLTDQRNSQRTFLTNFHLSHTISTNWYQDLTVGYNIVNYGQNNNLMDIYSNLYANLEYLFSKVNVRYFMFYDHSWSTIFKSSITAGFEYNGYDTHNLLFNSTSPLTNFFTINTPAIEGTATFSKSPYSAKGYFAEAVTGFKNNLFLTTGIRFDVNPAYGDNVGAYAQPRVGLSYVMESGKFKIKPRAVWGVSSTAPEPVYKTSSVLVFSYGNYVYIGNPNIKPQRSQGYEFGADIFYGSNYTLNVTYYNQKIKDMIQGTFTPDFTTNPATYYFYYFNIAEAINKGLEVSVKTVFDPFTLDLSYTQTVSKWGNETGQATTAILYPGGPVSNIPKKSLFVRLGYKIPAILPWTKKGGNLSLDWRYNGSAFSYDEISYTLATDAWANLPDPKPDYPDYTKYYSWQKGYSYFNLRADYSVTNYMALYVDVQNLLDKQGSVTGRSLNQFPGRRINFGFNLQF